MGTASTRVTFWYLFCPKWTNIAKVMSVLVKCCLPVALLVRIDLQDWAQILEQSSAQALPQLKLKQIWCFPTLSTTLLCLEQQLGV